MASIWLWILLTSFLTASGHIQPSLVSLTISRHHLGDLFLAKGATCYKDLCVGVSSGTADTVDGGAVPGCGCQCLPNLPVFRDDLNICVDDIHECTLAPFVSGTTSQKIPFVFLPLKGQIVYPSAEITISDVSSPICVVSGAQYLGRGGWLDLRNTSDTEPPFRLFRDERRTYLQWLGDGDLRSAMEGRLILVHLMCKDATESEQHRILTPCVAFRVAGNPSVREVVFSTDVRSTEEQPSGFSVSEYIAIGVCSILLGLIYVASVMLYLHMRKRRRKARDKDAESAHLTVEEGVVKNNPLLQPGRRHHGKGGGSSGHDNDGYSSDSVSCCSDSDVPSDLGAIDDEDDTPQQNIQTSAVVHPCAAERPPRESPNQDSFERLPEEDVSIIEEVEDREDRPESVHAMGGANIRRKLYFNPAYFELDLLKTPPPAAIEFLTKIREVIAVAKHKMSAKRFSPSLIGIPEEDQSSRDRAPGMRSRASSVTSMHSASKATSLNKSTTGSCCPTETKQQIIRKWLKDVPTSRKVEKVKATPQAVKEVKIAVEGVSKEARPSRPSPPPPPTRAVELKRPSVKGPAPPRPPPPNPTKTMKQVQAKQDIPNFSNMPFLTTFKGKNVPDVPPPIPTSQPGPLPNTTPKAPSPPPLPKDNPDNTPRFHGKDKVPKAVAKTLMDAVIEELGVQNKFETKKTIVGEIAANLASAIDLKVNEKDEVIEYESDSLERNKQIEKSQKGFRLFESCDDYEEQIDSCIDTCQQSVETSIPDVIQQPKPSNQDDHDYEVIHLNPDIASQLEEKELKIYNLPEILSKNEGYSLVSEVYVNDGYSYSSGEASPNSESPTSQSNHQEQIKPSRLTIQVKDDPENYKHIPDESDSFEPDTLDRKPGKLKIVDNFTNWEDSAQEKYSNQKFHGLEMECQHQNQNNQYPYISNDNFMDSLERPQIMLKSNGSFRKTSIERHVDDLLRTLDSPLAKDFSSLREIYEAKSKNNRKRTETTSLVGSVTSDTDCMSTMSWNEDRRNKLRHRGIILHMGSGRKSRKSRNQGDVNNYPDVVPPRPPKPASLSATPQRSGTTTPAARSYGPSVCTTPNRSACTSPPPRPCFSPVRTCPTPPPPPRLCPTPPMPPSRRSCTPPPPPRLCPTPPPPPPPRSSPPPSPTPRNGTATTTPLRSKCTSPAPATSPPSRSRNTSGRASPISRNCRSPCRSPSRSMCTSPSPSHYSTKSHDNSPPLPPRNLRPPLPPKNARSTRQKKTETSSNVLARRPLPPLPSRSYHDTLSSVSSRDLETLSTLSGASMDSLNSSDYEAFYTLPYNGDDGEIYDKAQDKFHRAQLEKAKQYKNFPIIQPHSENVFSTDEDIYNAINMSSTFREKVKDLRMRSRKTGGKWRATPGTGMHKPEDSGYLSTDSNESSLRMGLPTVPRIPERSETPSQGSETEGSNDGDGASESGAESTATDSFFFGKCRKDDGSVFRQSFRLSDVEVNSDTERHNFPIMVHH